MLGRADIELLQRRQDGDLRPDEMQRLENLLTRNPEARMAMAALKALDEGLETGGSVEPPEDGVADIMARVQAGPHPSRQGWRSLVLGVRRATGSIVEAVAGSESRLEEPMSSRSKIVWGIS